MTDVVPYAAPALEKGLDILELLAAGERALTMTAIAEALGRSKSEIFRMVMVLLERGYVSRDPETDAFTLTNRLFDIALRTPLVKNLVAEAVPALGKLADATGHSAHLVVLHRGETVVMAALPGGSDMSFTLRLGYRRVSIVATSGQVIIAFQPPAIQARLIADARALSATAIDPGELNASLDRIRAKGSEMHASRDFVGITDICAPILDAEGHALASVIISYVNRHARQPRHDAVLEGLTETCAMIGAALRGHAPR